MSTTPTPNKFNNFPTIPLTDKNSVYVNGSIKKADYNAIVLHVPEDMVKKGGWLLNDVNSNKLEFTLMLDVICGVVHIALESEYANHDAVIVAYEMLPTKKSGMDVSEERQRTSQKYVSLYPEKSDKPQIGYNIWVWIKKKRFLPERKCKKTKTVLEPTEEDVVIDELVKKYWEIRTGKNKGKKEKITLPKNPWLIKELSKKSNMFEQLQLAIEKFCPCYDFKNSDFQKIVSSSTMSTIGDFVNSKESAFSFSTRMTPYIALIGAYFEMNKQCLGTANDLYSFLDGYGISSINSRGTDSGGYVFPSPRNVLYFPARKLSSQTLIVSPWRQKMDLPFMFDIYDEFAKYEYPEEIKRVLNLNSFVETNDKEISDREEDFINEENTFQAQPVSQSDLCDIDDTANDGNITGLMNKHIKTNKIPVQKEINQKPMMTIEKEREIWEEVFSNVALVHDTNNLPSPIDDYILRCAMQHKLFYSTFDIGKLTVKEGEEKQREFFYLVFDDFMDLLASDLVNDEVKVIFKYALNMFQKERRDPVNRVFDWKIENGALDSFSIFGKFLTTFMSQLETLFHCYTNHTYVFNLIVNGFSIYNIMNNGLMPHKMSIGKAEAGKSKGYHIVQSIVIPDSFKSRVHTTGGSYLNASPNIFYLWIYFEEFVNLMIKNSENSSLFKNMTAQNKIVCIRSQKNPVTNEYETVVVEFKRYMMMYISMNNPKTDVDDATLSRFDIRYISNIPRVDKTKTETIETEKEKKENNVNQPIIDKSLEMIRAIQVFVALSYIMIAAKMIVPIDNKLAEEIFAKASKLFSGGMNVRKDSMMNEFSRILVLMKAFLEGFVNTDRKFLPENFYDVSIHMYATLETALNTLALMENLDDSLKSLFKKKLAVYYKRDIIKSVSKDIVDDALGKYEKTLVAKVLGEDGGQSVLFKKPVLNNPKKTNNVSSNQNISKKFDTTNHDDYPNGNNKDGPSFVQENEYNVNYYSQPIKGSLYKFYHEIVDTEIKRVVKNIDMGDGRTFSYDKKFGDITTDQVKCLLSELKSTTVTTKWMICSKIKEGKATLYFPDDESCNEKEKFYHLKEWNEATKTLDITTLPSHKYINKFRELVTKDSPHCIGVIVFIEPQCRRRPGKNMDIYHKFPLVIEKNDHLMIHRSYLNKKEMIHSKDKDSSYEKLANRYLEEMTDPKKMSICRQINGKQLKKYCYLLNQGFLTPNTEEKDIVVCLPPSLSLGPYLCSVISLKPTEQVSIISNTNDLYNDTLGIAASVMKSDELESINGSFSGEMEITKDTEVCNFVKYFRRKGVLNTNLMDVDLKSFYDRVIKYYIIPDNDAKDKYYPESPMMDIGKVDEVSYPDKQIFVLINVLNRRLITENFHNNPVVYPSIDKMSHMSGVKVRKNDLKLLKHMIPQFDLWLELEMSVKIGYDDKIKIIEQALDYDVLKTKEFVIDKMIADMMTQDVFGLRTSNKESLTERLSMYTKLFKSVCTWKKGRVIEEKNKEEGNRRKIERIEEMKRSTSKIIERLMVPTTKNDDNDLDTLTKKTSVINNFDLNNYKSVYDEHVITESAFKDRETIKKYVCGGIHCMLKVYSKLDSVYKKNIILLEKFLNDTANEENTDQMITQTMQRLIVSKNEKKQLGNAINKWGLIDKRTRFSYNKEIIKQIVDWITKKRDIKAEGEIIEDLKKYDRKHYELKYSKSCRYLPNTLTEISYDLFTAMNFHVYYDARFWGDASHALRVTATMQSVLDSNEDKEETVKIEGREVKISIESLKTSFFDTLVRIKFSGGDLIEESKIYDLIELWKSIKKEDLLCVLRVLMDFYTDYINTTYIKEEVAKAIDEMNFRTIDIAEDDENSVGVFLSEDEDQAIEEEIGSKKRKPEEEIDERLSKKHQVDICFEDEEEYGGDYMDDEKQDIDERVDKGKK